MPKIRYQHIALLSARQSPRRSASARIAAIDRPCPQSDNPNMTSILSINVVDLTPALVARFQAMRSLRFVNVLLGVLLAFFGGGSLARVPLVLPAEGSLHARVPLALPAEGSLHARVPLALPAEGSPDPFAEPRFLPVDEAFVWSAGIEGRGEGQGRLVVRWRVADGYYLYRHGFALETDAETTLGELEIPPGKRIVDDYFGESEVYYGAVAVGAVVQRRTTSTITARIRYQGCADYGLCYPSQQRTITVEASAH